MSRGAFYVLFTASGFAGLIYESVWTHYLKLFLGHAAYAQSLVLAVFMGGMAAGAAWCGRRSGRIANPLAAYAIVEAAIGLAALVFHDLFAGLHPVQNLDVASRPHAQFDPARIEQALAARPKTAREPRPLRTDHDCHRASDQDDREDAHGGILPLLQRPGQRREG